MEPLFWLLPLIPTQALVCWKIAESEKTLQTRFGLLLSCFCYAYGEKRLLANAIGGLMNMGKNANKKNRIQRSLKYFFVDECKWQYIHTDFSSLLKSSLHVLIQNSQYVCVYIYIYIRYYFYGLFICYIEAFSEWMPKSVAVGVEMKVEGLDSRDEELAKCWIED